MSVYTPLPWYCTLDKPKSWTLELANCARAADARGISKIFETKFTHRARVARPRGFDSLPFLDPDRGRCDR